MAAVLLVDDEPSARAIMALLLKKRGHRVSEAGEVGAAIKALATTAFEVVVTDLRMPDGDGLDVLRAAKVHCPEADVILLTAYAGGIGQGGDPARRLRLLREGARAGRIAPPHRPRRRGQGAAARDENLRAQVRERFGLPGLIATSAQMGQVLDLVGRVAPTDATVLIRGESGTGKEVIAKAIHHASRRASARFVAINCGALPETLARVGDLRAREGRVHRRGREQERSVRGGRRRHPLP